MERDANVEQKQRDVAIVENTAEAWTAESAWRIEENPQLAIGRVDGPVEYQLFRVMRAVRLANGTIVVANGGTSEIRFFDATGKHTRSVGGRGAGPGEYESLPFFRRLGADSLIAWDGRLNRGTVLSLDGTYGRTVSRPDFGGAFVVYVDAFGDGSLLGLALGYSGGRLPGRTEVEEEAVRGVSLQTRPQGLMADSALLFRQTSSGQIDTIGGFFYYESYRAGGTMTGMPFGRHAAAVTAGNLLHYGSGEAFEIRTYNTKGQLLRITRTTRTNPELTPAMIDEFIEKMMSRSNDPAYRNRMRMLYSSVVYPKTVPAYSDLAVDAAGNLWVSGFHHPFETQPHWTVFDGNGRLLGNVKAPLGFTIYEIGTDHVLGKSTDAFDVERVALHRLVKPQ
ncbi:MAG: hypothetical protein ACRENP_07815 [Longimicrobiales bacterium]